MDFCLRTFATLFLLFTATTCAPARSLQDAWASLGSRSQELHQIARRVSVEARNGSKDIDDFVTELGWIESKDKCDPETLKREPEPCLAKILSVSVSYSSALKKFSTYESCAKHATTMVTALSKFQKALTECMHLSIPQVVSIDKTIAEWEQSPLCLYTLDRLFSFSIITARVFAVGNPAHHTAGPSQKCKAT